MNLLTDHDLTWIADMLDAVTACCGQPWRVALERLDSMQPRASTSNDDDDNDDDDNDDHSDDDHDRHHDHQHGDGRRSRRISQKRIVAVIRAIQRVLGRSTNSDLAKTCRALVLGRPALDHTERLDRIAAAARSLELSTSAVERLLWVDLPRERPIEMPYGRPSELEIAAFANLQLIETALRRAQTARLRVRGESGPLLRGAARCGLLTHARGDGAQTTIEIVGPLALFHRTAVYGRALAALVPLLAEVEGFELTITSTGMSGDYVVQLASPALLPRTSASLHAPSKLVTRLARDLGKQLRDRDRLDPIVVAPPVIAVNGSYVCPDLQIGDTYVEIVGFWTVEHLAKKRSAYAAAGLHVVLCVDEQRGCAAEDIPPDVVGFTKHVSAERVVEQLA